jgi:hypothetical protein
LTKPQRIVNEILDNKNIKYKNEGDFKYYAVDNYLIDDCLVIEVMGDYWHGNPCKYSYNYNDIQRKRVIKDKAKHTYIKQYYDIEILYLWEDDLYNRSYLCKRLIMEYIKNKGCLDNYHSFNYHIKNNRLLLNDKLIYAYFDEDYNNKESVETVIPNTVT